MLINKVQLTPLVNRTVLLFGKYRDHHGFKSNLIYMLIVFLPSRDLREARLKPMTDGFIEEDHLIVHHGLGSSALHHPVFLR